MEQILTLVPVTRAEARALAGGTEPRCPRQAFAATAELVAALGYAPDQGEDAEYAALVLASVWALAQFGERVVLVAELDPSLVGEGEEPDNGGVRVSAVPRGSVVAWFTDEPDASGAAARAASEAKDKDIDTAWDLQAVQDLVTQHDLLWHGVDELDTIEEA